MMEDIISERKTKVQYTGQRLLTIPEIAKAMDMSQSRIRFLLAKPDGPKPVFEGERYYRGRVKSIYDLKDVVKYFIETKKQPSMKLIYLKRYVDLGYINANEVQM